MLAEKVGELVKPGQHDGACFCGESAFPLAGISVNSIKSVGHDLGTLHRGAASPSEAAYQVYRVSRAHNALVCKKAFASPLTRQPNRQTVVP
jgi:hypothetical protein